MPQQQDLARAGASVVRLLVSYNQPDQYASAPVILAQCTGLGVLVGSGVNATDKKQENWVLTDANLLNTGKAQCVRNQPNAQLSSVAIYMSCAYSGTPSTEPIATISASDLKGMQQQKGLAVFPFHSDTIKLLPYVRVAIADPTQQAVLYLSNDGSKPNVPSLLFNADTKQFASFKTQTLQYLTPSRLSLASPQDFASAEKEPGTPLVNSTGNLAAMSIATGTLINSADIQKLLQSVDAIKNPPSNVVDNNWQNGITAYYARQYANAQQSFEAAAQNNSDFVGAQQFADAAKSAAASTTSAPPATGTKSSSLAGSGTISGIPIWLVSVVGLILLFALVVAAGLYFRRYRARQNRLAGKDDQTKYQPSLDVQRSMEELQPQRIRANEELRQPLQTQAILPPSVPAPSPPVKTSPVDIQQVSCPNCGRRVSGGGSYCSDCGYSLVSTPQTLSQSGQPSLPLKKPVVTVDPLPASSFSSRSQEVSPMQTPVQESSPDVVTPDSVALPPSKEPEEAVNALSDIATIGETGRIGQRLGNYRLVGSLGRGGFADVYLGEHVFLKTRAAIKVQHAYLSKEALAGFLKEARTIADLVHPHIVRVLEFGVEGVEPDLESSVFNAEGCIPYLIMDYAPGGTLRKRHPKGTPVPLTTIVPYVKDIADALQYAHERKRIHRDIKPENMLIGRKDEALLSDFGIAAVAHGEHSMSTQEMAGTIPYMAPEQLRGKPRPASDQYALAIVIYEWLCGSRPFQGSQWEVVNQHLSAFPPPLYKKGVSIAPSVEAVIMKALAKDPTQRFASVQEFAQAFEQAISSH